MEPRLSGVDPSSTPDAPGDRATTEATTDALRNELIDLQARLFAEHKQSLLVVVQAMDAGGKDGVIRKVFAGVNPQGMRVRAFKPPSSEELDHDFLWRVHPHVPARGEIVIFNRSHYEAVLVERVRRLTPKSVWSSRYESIRAFEATLRESNTRVLKFFLHISKEEQLRRFQARRDNPAKRWKLDPADLEMTKKWNHFMRAYQDVFEKTSTLDAPWTIVPADHKWYRDWAVMDRVVAALRDMNPRYPNVAP